ncbi:response regulator [Paenibacillus sp. N1-5-1-14]|uniref:response regulator n=1 Tax=Paenibacillus radicibacter TaxID=2972488 RepID=UPI0021599C93|nr:response regulator [Paenibacillus radicibacter]MCR8642540.1 response regulator [Paenibacillus radicibacter]
MYNILVVDDEPRICKGVSAILLQSGLAIREVMTAGNGFEALDLMRIEQVDLVITDIQMSGMDGIELIQAISMDNPAIPIIVFSAHGEFEYAQKALHFGVKDYLLKPIAEEQLLQTVSRALAGKQERAKYSLDTDLIDKFSLKEVLTNENYVLNEILNEQIDQEEITDILTHLGKRIEGSYYCLLAFQLDLNSAGFNNDKIKSYRDKNLLKYACLNIIEESLDKREKLTFYRMNNQIIVLLPFDSEEINSAHFPAQQQLFILSNTLLMNLQTFINVKCKVGMSRIHSGIENAYTMYGEAEAALKWGENSQDYTVLYFGDLETHEKVLQVDVGGSNVGKTVAHEEHNTFIKETMAFIEQFYMRRGLKLQDIANSVHLSSNYLSYLFKKHVGLNVWDYVTQLRMEEGKRLILHTDKKRYEIAELVGYESPEHFGKVFKKYFGISTSEVKH